MGEVKVRKLDDWVIKAWQNRAQGAGRSLEEELRQALTEGALRPQHEFASLAAQLRAAIQKAVGPMSDSTAQIQADREARG